MGGGPELSPNCSEHSQQSIDESNCPPHVEIEGNFDFEQFVRFRLVPAGNIMGQPFTGCQNRTEKPVSPSKWLAKHKNEECVDDPNIEGREYPIQYKAVCSEKEIEEKLQWTREELKEQLKRFERRFKAFVWIVSHPGVQYDSETSIITAAARMWTYFKLEEPLAYAFEQE